jgi:hypothetical protein
VCLVDVFGTDVLHLIAAATFRAAAEGAIAGDLVAKHDQPMSQDITYHLCFLSFRAPSFLLRSKLIDRL